ncbi:hypothetical protein [Lichenicoccus sp.]|uniref:hypothetical protein n=1 Tax=Lichenicoccus sp. TaxID=2781899 RepID=UPI003D11390A
MMIHPPRTRPGATLPPAATRALLLLAVAAGLAAGTIAAISAPATVDADMAHLLRAMALLKAAIAVVVTGAVLWRFGAPVGPIRLAGYALACAAMAAGPGLIWGMVHLGAGALLLHGGLLAAIVLFWRDPEIAARLAAMITARRAAIRARQN